MHAGLAPTGGARSRLPLALPCRQQIKDLLAKITANWCADRPYITAEQAIDEVTQDFKQYSG